MVDGISKDVLARFSALRALVGGEVYEQTADPLDMFRRTLREFYNYKDIDISLMVPSFVYMESLLCITAEVMKRFPNDAIHIVGAFVHDYPGVQGSNLAGRWSALVEVFISFKSVMNNPSNIIGMWELSKAIHLNFNEFLNGLLPFIILGLKSEDGIAKNLKIFKSPYKEKLDTLLSFNVRLSDRAMPLALLSDRLIRNAIGHSDIYFDADTNIVRYGEQQGVSRIEHRMPIYDFILKAAWYSYIPHAHEAMIAAVYLLMNGNEQDKSDVKFALVNRKLPEHSL